MWAHYAQNLQRFVIEIDEEKCRTDVDKVPESSRCKKSKRYQLIRSCDELQL
jgi:hypothetical protein